VESATSATSAAEVVEEEHSTTDVKEETPDEGLYRISQQKYP